MKKNLNIKKFRRADTAVIAFFLLCAAVFAAIGVGSGSAEAQIICRGEILYEINLSQVKKPYTISLDNGVDIRVEKNSAGFIKSDCAGQDCVKCGMLSRPGEVAVCAPNATVIKLISSKAGFIPDAVSY